jgi:hypothetical protein
MLRLTPRRNRRVPNGLAILGAFLLAASVLAGAGHSIPDARQQASTLATTLAGTHATGTAGAPAAGSAEEFGTDITLREAAVTRTRKFRVNLFLFRH